MSDIAIIKLAMVIGVTLVLCSFSVAQCANSETEKWRQHNEYSRSLERRDQ